MWVLHFKGGGRTLFAESTPTSATYCRFLAAQNAVLKPQRGARRFAGGLGEVRSHFFMARATVYKFKIEFHRNLQKT